MLDEKDFENEELNVTPETEEETKTPSETVEETVSETADAVEEAVEKAEDAVEEAVEATAEAVADGIEEATEAVEDGIGEAAEAVEEIIYDMDEAEDAAELTETEKAVQEALAKRDAEDAAKTAEKQKMIKLIAIIAAAVIVVAGIIVSGFVSSDIDANTGINKGTRFNTYSGWLPKLVNKYNHKGYIDVTERTLGDILVETGMELPEFLETYSLPADMPKSTFEMAVIYTMPAKNYAQMNGLDYETLKKLLNIPDKAEDGTELTADTEWGIVEGEIAIKDYINGEDNFEEFKKNYEIDDDITADLKWNTVRNQVDSYSKNKRKKEAKAEAKQAEATEEPKATDAPKDDKKATESPKATDAPKN